MPKRSERNEYAHVFDGNPYEGEHASDMYTRLRWGNAPSAAWEIDGPEDMATLGVVAKLYSNGRTLEQYSEDDGPFLAVGRDTNLLYIVPRYEQDGSPIDISGDFGSYHYVCTLSRTDYYSDKGGEPCYYYHNHERPYPGLYLHHSGVGIVVPADNKGKRSYAVGDAGIIG